MCLLLISRKYVIYVRSGFLLVLRIGCVILLSHSLGLSYNYSHELHEKSLAASPNLLQYFEKNAL